MIKILFTLLLLILIYLLTRTENFRTQLDLTRKSINIYKAKQDYEFSVYLYVVGYCSYETLKEKYKNYREISNLISYEEEKFIYKPKLNKSGWRNRCPKYLNMDKRLNIKRFKFLKAI